MLGTSDYLLKKIKVQVKSIKKWIEGEILFSTDSSK